MRNRISSRCAPCRQSDRIFALAQAALDDAARCHAPRDADAHPGRTAHLLRPSSPTSPIDPGGVRVCFRPSARQAVPERYSRLQQLANRTHRNQVPYQKIARQSHQQQPGHDPHRQVIDLARWLAESPSRVRHVPLVSTGQTAPMQKSCLRHRAIRRRQTRRSWLVLPKRQEGRTFVIMKIPDNDVLVTQQRHRFIDGAISNA